VSSSVLGTDVRVVIPRYSSLAVQGRPVKMVFPSMGVWMGGTCEWCSVQSIETDANVPVYLIEHHLFFSREGIYHDQSMQDYLDNPRRFAFLSRAALQLCLDTGFAPDIVHANDWQTALAARVPQGVALEQFTLGGTLGAHGPQPGLPGRVRARQLALHRLETRTLRRQIRVRTTG